MLSNRRRFLGWLGSMGVASLAGYHFWPDEGLWNPCPSEGLPEHLLQHELVSAAWAGIEPAQVWDCHAHLIGLGDNQSGVWLNPKMRSLRHPIQYTQLQFYLNASCVHRSGYMDHDFVQRLLHLLNDFPQGVKLMLLAFDYHYDTNGDRVLDKSPFYTPNQYAANLVKQHPDQFEWIASIHPYRNEAVQALEQAVKFGARAVKWLPPAMGIDPASPRCDLFYQALVRLGIPLLTHAGHEHAVDAADAQALGNPLLLRRALEHGVTVIVAHCATMGSSLDIDKAVAGPPVENIKLFARLMDEPDYQGKLYGDISAVTQINRTQEALETIFIRDDWHHRLINGSDYPLPGVMPIFSLKEMLARKYITLAEANVLSEIRTYNPLLFDFLLKRTMRVQGKKLSKSVFESRRVF